MKPKSLILIGIIIALGSVFTFATIDYLDQLSFDLFSNVPYQLQGVLDYCEEKKEGRDMNLIGLSYYNDTHYIDNDKCQWQLLENYPDTYIQCIPGEHRYADDDDDVIHMNSTHTFDNNKCEWDETFSWEKQYPESSSAKLEVGHKIYPAFANGVTEIINPKHGQLKYYATLQVIDDEYLGNTVEEWQHASGYDLDLQHETIPDHKFYGNLGHLLMKNEMTYQMQMLGIVNADGDFTVLQGSSLQSNPPHIGYSSVIHATDGNYYWLQGGTHANHVNYYKTTQLQYPDESKFPNIESVSTMLPDERIPRISITEVGGNDLNAEPYHIILSQPGDVEFYNDTPEKLTVYLNKEGVDEFSFDTSQNISTRSNSGTAYPFDGPGVYSFHAEVPKIIDGKQYELNTGGAITILSDDMDDLPQAVQIEIAMMLLSSSELPISGMGQQGTDNIISISLNHSIGQLLPESESYYVKAAQHLMPFDIEIVLR